MEKLEDLQERQNKELLKRNNPLQLYPESLNQLLDHTFPPVRWIVDGLIPAEGVTIISAAPASFKTWILLEIAINVAQGKKLFGEYKTSEANILIVDEETGSRSLHERFKQLRATRGLPIFCFTREGHKITQEGYIESLLSCCAANDIEFVIFDSLMRMHNGEENSSKDMALVLDKFKQLADNGIAVLIAHHNRKSQPGVGSSAADMRGSSDILAAVDCHIAVTRKASSEFVKLRQTKNRHAREIKPFDLRFVEKAGYSEFEYVGSEQSYADVHQEQLDLIANAVTEHPGLTKGDLIKLIKAAGGQYGETRTAECLNELAKGGVITPKPGLRTAVHYYLAGVEDPSIAETQ